MKPHLPLSDPFLDLSGIKDLDLLGYSSVIAIRSSSIIFYLSVMSGESIGISETEKLASVFFNLIYGMFRRKGLSLIYL